MVTLWKKYKNFYLGKELKDVTWDCEIFEPGESFFLSYIILFLHQGTHPLLICFSGTSDNPLLESHLVDESNLTFQGTSMSLTNSQFFAYCAKSRVIVEDKQRALNSSYHIQAGLFKADLTRCLGYMMQGEGKKIATSTWHGIFAKQGDLVVRLSWVSSTQLHSFLGIRSF